MRKKSKVTSMIFVYLIVTLTGCSGVPEHNADNLDTALNETDSEQKETSEVMFEAEIPETALEGDGSEPPLESALSEVEPESEPELRFEPTSDLTVSLAYTYDNSRFIVVENTCDRAILDYRIAFTEFDKNGFSVTTNSYDTGRVEAANLLPGEKKSHRFTVQMENI